MTARTVPDRVIEGDGFCLRALRPNDANDIAVACSDVLTQHWLPLPQPYTVEIARDFITRQAVSQRDSGLGAVFAIDVEGRLHGCIDLKRTDWRAGTSEIGYWVAPWARGAGLAGRAAATLARWALVELGLQRVEVRVAGDNVASQRSAETAGFCREGVLRCAGHTHDGQVDLVVYSMVRSDLDVGSGTTDLEDAEGLGRRQPGAAQAPGLFTDPPLQ